MHIYMMCGLVGTRPKTKLPQHFVVDLPCWNVSQMCWLSIGFIQLDAILEFTNILFWRILTSWYEWQYQQHNFSFKWLYLLYHLSPISFWPSLSSFINQHTQKLWNKTSEYGLLLAFKCEYWENHCWCITHLFILHKYYRHSCISSSFNVCQQLSKFGLHMLDKLNVLLS